MLLSDAKLFTPAHYEAHRGVAPPDLCELVVHCLELVAQLSHSGLEYRFKGGNSQLVLLETPERFSIDVDIVTTVERDALTACVEQVVERCDLFTRAEVRPHKTKPWLPILSFKLFFESEYESPPADAPQGPEPCVMLDAVLEPAPYGGVRKRVACGALYQSEQTVELPTVGGLLADKMLCISPATVGIPLGKKKEGHRLKHVFDVATLSRHAPDVIEVRAALEACLAQENAIQKTAYTFAEVREDTERFCRDVLAHEAPPPLDSLVVGTYLDEITQGFPDVEQFLFRRAYSWARLREDCAEVIEAMKRVAQA